MGFGSFLELEWMDGMDGWMDGSYTLDSYNYWSTCVAKKTKMPERAVTPMGVGKSSASHMWLPKMIFSHVDTWLFVISLEICWCQSDTDERVWGVLPHTCDRPISNISTTPTALRHIWCVEHFTEYFSTNFTVHVPLLGFCRTWADRSICPPLSWWS